MKAARISSLQVRSETHARRSRTPEPGAKHRPGGAIDWINEPFGLTPQQVRSNPGISPDNTYDYYYRIPGGDYRRAGREQMYFPFYLARYGADTILMDKGHTGSSSPVCISD